VLPSYWIENGGIEKIRGNNPDLVITDLNMPGMRGEEVLRWIAREHRPTHPSIKAIAMSGDDLPATESAARAAGADEFLSKPSGLGNLAAAIENLLRD
jgi:CheY-like chemotaxis protein